QGVPDMRRPQEWKNWLACLGLALTSVVAIAQDIQPAAHRRCPPEPCPPATQCLPLSPAPPGTPGSPVAPGQTPTPAAAAPTVAYAEAPSAGTGGSASIAPNMMGDLLGSRAIILQGISRNLVVSFPNPPAVPGGVQVTPSTGSFAFGGLAASA